MDISEDMMWKATVECNSEYDGRFFYAVKTVGVFCRPSCKSRTPLRRNLFFSYPVRKPRRLVFVRASVAVLICQTTRRLRSLPNKQEI